jgi:hypothetical protein
MNEKDLTTSALIDYMIEEWGGNFFFQKGLSQIKEVHAHVNRTLFLVN